MSDLYKRIEELCENKKINITVMCRESGASRASLTDLKMGRKQGLSTETLFKIATYFNVSVDYLLGTKIEKAPADDDERKVSDDDIKFALFGTREIDDDVLDRVKQFAKFAQENEKNK